MPSLSKVARSSGRLQPMGAVQGQYIGIHRAVEGGGARAAGGREVQWGSAACQAWPAAPGQPASAGKQTGTLNRIPAL